MSKAKKERVPEIRFQGFEGEWKKTKIKNISKVRRGASPRPISEKKWFDELSDVGWIRISDVTEQNGRIKRLDQKLSLAGQEKTVVLEKKYLLLSIAASIGKPVINYIKTGVHDGFVVFYENLFDIEYMFHWFTYFQPNWRKYGQQGSQINLNSELIRNQSVYIPEIYEQHKIAEFFEKLDRLIELQEKTVEKNKRLKKALLQKMFPKKGQTTPELRLAGFTGEWKEVKLGDRFKIVMGESPKGKYYTENPNDTILIQGNADLKDGKVVPRIWTTQETKISEKGEIILTVRAPVGSVAINDFRAVLGRGVCSIDGNQFLYQKLIHLSQSHYWVRYSTGSTFESINSNDIKNANIFIPDHLEQQKIGQLFKTLDDTIELEEQTLETYKKLKQSLLQKMFV